MALNIKNPAVERLAGEVALLTGESKTEAIRKALEDRKRRLVAAPVSDRRATVLAFLKKRVWTGIPRKEKGRVLARSEEDAILGYGPEGV
ncbi:MAG: type II toxin-antitoxin system VapB family antitoxin [Acidobacteria bacterium]|jgi:antitoxin VapB|nr:type II toxin-antitoxin system VapB family antitoxin [Acidobacteriota bacterium]